MADVRETPLAAFLAQHILNVGDLAELVPCELLLDEHQIGDPEHPRLAVAGRHRHRAGIIAPVDLAWRARPRVPARVHGENSRVDLFSYDKSVGEDA